MRLLTLLVVIFTVFSNTQAVQAGIIGPICYVDDSATPPGTGDDWASAFTDLQSALAQNACTEIWVAAGIYKPDTANRNLSFVLKNGVAIYGGFFGDELFRQDRDSATNVTILSGNIGAAGDATDNSFNVVRSGANGPINSTAVLDGFTIEDGYADGGTIPTREGGGMYNDASSPTLKNLVFRNNYAERFGGGIANHNGSDMTLTNVAFNNNTGNGGGGAIFNNTSSLFVTNTTFSANTGGEGGAIHSWIYEALPASDYYLTIANSTFYDNQAGYGGAVSTLTSEGNRLISHMTNVTFNSNNAQRAGAIHIYSFGPYAAQPGGINIVTLSNVILWENTVTQPHNGLEIRLQDDGYPESIVLNIDHSIITEGDTEQYTATAYAAGEGNLNTNPRLMALADKGGYTKTQALIPGSSAIDNGNDTTCNNALGAPDFGAGGLDQRGVSRPLGDQCDIGAVEREPTAPSVLYVQPDGTSLTCTGWGTANSCQLQDALALAFVADQVWVKAGTYLPDGANPGDPSLSFVLRDGVGIYGGFFGDENVLEERDPAANVTILSGNIGVPGDATDNTWHVVHGVGEYGGMGSDAVLDGFTIEGGYADGGTSEAKRGGGMYNLGSSPTLMNLVFRNNHAETSGGGMYNSGSSPTLINLAFTNNHANTNGGGMSNEAGSNPNLTNVAFTSNTASGSSISMGAGMYSKDSSAVLNYVTFSMNIAGTAGGGMHLDASDTNLTNVLFSNNSSIAGGAMNIISSSPSLTNVLFDSNHATGVGASSGYGGAMFAVVSRPGPLLTNVTATGNTADKGGAIYVSNSTTTLKNSTIAGMNTARTDDGHAVFTNSGTLVIENSIVYANGPAGDETGIGQFSASANIMKDSITHSGCVGGFACTNMSDADPVLGSLADNGGFTRTMALLNGSGAIDTGGINTTCAPVDQRDVLRPQGPRCDIGAYEKIGDFIFGNSFEGLEP